MSGQDLDWDTFAVGTVVSCAADRKDILTRVAAIEPIHVAAITSRRRVRGGRQALCSRTTRAAASLRQGFLLTATVKPVDVPPVTQEFGAGNARSAIVGYACEPLRMEFREALAYGLFAAAVTHSIP